MKRKLLLTALYMCGGLGAFGNEIAYVERFAIADDRSEALRELVPGTEDFYYYHALHAQNKADRARFEELMAQYQDTFKNSPRATELLNRQALLDFKEQPAKSAQYILRHLGIHHSHERIELDQEARLPPFLDPASIASTTLLARHTAQRDHLSQIKDEGLYALDPNTLTPAQRREWLNRLPRTNVPHLPQWVVNDLKAERSGGFGSLRVHDIMTLPQLEECLALHPELTTNARFVQEMLARFRPGADVDPASDPAEQEHYLITAWSFVQDLTPAFNSQKASILYALLNLQRQRGVYDAALFTRYLELPRTLGYVPLPRTKSTPREALVNLQYNGLTPLGIPPIQDESELVADFLEHFLTKADNTAPFAPYFTKEYLDAAWATANILAGHGSTERWAALLGASAYRALRDRIEIQFPPNVPRHFAPDDNVTLNVRVKNVPELLVRTYEINTLNYFRETGEPLNIGLDLDGLVAGHETRITLPEPAERRTLQTLALPHCQGRGAWIIELIGNGISSRALIRKGNLTALTRITPHGLLVTVIDENRNPVPTASVLLGAREYSPDAQGRILLPFSTDEESSSRSPTRRVVLRDGDFCALEELEVPPESYTFSAGMFTEREQLLAGNEATVLLRPILQIHNQPISVSRLENIRLVITGTTRAGISTSSEVRLASFEDAKETAHRFMVPEDLNSVTITVYASLRHGSSNEPKNFTDAKTWSINHQLTQPSLYSLYAGQSDKGHVVELRGLNGEPLATRPIQFSFQHRFVTEPVNITLATDAQGRCHLGALPGIHTVTATDPANGSLTFRPPTLETTLTPAIHHPANVRIILPMDQQDRLALFELRDNEYRNDLSANLERSTTSLTIPPLAAGDYELHNITHNHTTRLRIVAGNDNGSHLLGTSRIVGKSDMLPAIPVVTADPTHLRIQVEQTNAFTRVHVTASRFLTQHSLFWALQDSKQSGLAWRQARPPQTLYASARNIGDEYRYVLDRLNTRAYPGNMLPRPGLILNPWERETTTAASETLRRGEAPMAMAAEMDALMSAARLMAPTSDQAPYQPTFEFLPRPSVLISNLVPDDKGRISIPLEAFDGLPFIQVLVIDLRSSTLVPMALPERPVEPLDLRLKNTLAADKHWVESKRITSLTDGQDLSIQRGQNAETKIYHSANDLLALFTSFHPEHLATFSFIGRWPSLPPEEKRETYSRYACHELHLFLHQKDPAFFAEVIRPYLLNKKDKTFVDQWLLNEPLDHYLEPRTFSQLNTMEKAMLARAMPQAREGIVRHLRDALAWTPPDPQTDDMLFSFTAATGGFGNEGMDPFGAPQEAALFFSLSEVSGQNKALSEQPRLRKSGEGRLEALAAAKPSAPPPPPIVRPAPTSEKSDKSREEVEQSGGRRQNDSSLISDKMDGLTLSGEVIPSPTALYRRPSATKELAEQNYYRLLPSQQNADLVPLDRFWVDLAAHDGNTPFLSKHFMRPRKNLTQVMGVLAFLSLGWDAPAPKIEETPDGHKITAKSPILVAHRETNPATTSSQTPGSLVRHFFRENDRHTLVDGVDVEKYIEDGFVRGELLGCKVIISNPEPREQIFQVLTQIPRGALPAANGFSTRSISLAVEAYASEALEFYFYFPEAGTFEQAPIYLSHNDEIVTASAPIVMNVAAVPAGEDKASWNYISQHGSPQSVLDFLTKENLEKTPLESIAWRMKDKAFFEKTIRILSARHLYNDTLWSYGLKHLDIPTSRAFVSQSHLANQSGLYIQSPLLDLDPIERNRFEHLEYEPLINPRAHRVGHTRTILNPKIRGQYEAFCRNLIYKDALSPLDRLALSQMLFLQDRVEEALSHLDRVPANAVTTSLQFAYLSAYAAMYREDLAAARRWAEPHANHPVTRWRERFQAVIAHLNEVTGDAPASDGSNRSALDQDRLAASEPTLEVTAEGNSVNIRARHVPSAVVRYYPMDIELLFSKQPFLADQKAAFSFIKPVLEQSVPIPADTPLVVHQIPEALRGKNLVIEVSAGGIRRPVTVYASTMHIEWMENFGQLKVLDRDTTKPLAKAYVKVFARLPDGSTAFHKDGYTDLRGRFDYVSRNEGDNPWPTKLSVLVLSSTHGASVREVSPPER